MRKVLMSLGAGMALVLAACGGKEDPKPASTTSTPAASESKNEPAKSESKGETSTSTKKEETPVTKPAATTAGSEVVGGATIEECYKRTQAAIEAKDVRTFWLCIDSDYHGVTMLAQKRACSSYAFNNSKRAEQLEALFKKHAVNIDDYEDDSAMFEPVKDKFACYADMVQFCGFISQMNITTGSKLKEVNDRTTDAIAWQAVPGASIEIYFTKTDDGSRWLIGPSVP